MVSFQLPCYERPCCETDFSSLAYPLLIFKLVRFNSRLFVQRSIIVYSSNYEYGYVYINLDGKIILERKKEKERFCDIGQIKIIFEILYLQFYDEK